MLPRQGPRRCSRVDGRGGDGGDGDHDALECGDGEFVVGVVGHRLFEDDVRQAEADRLAERDQVAHAEGGAAAAEGRGKLEARDTRDREGDGEPGGSGDAGAASRRHQRHHDGLQAADEGGGPWRVVGGVGIRRRQAGVGRACRVEGFGGTCARQRAPGWR